MAKNKKYERKLRVSLPEVMMAFVILVTLTLVSMYTYKAFTKKAENAKALSELKQMQESTLSKLLSSTGGEDLTVTCDGVTFSYNQATGRVVFEGKLISDDGGLNFTREIKEKFNDVKILEGNFNIEGDCIIYSTSNGKGSAKWQSGKLPEPIE